MRHFIGACLAAAIVAGCGSTSTQAPATAGTSAASAGQQTAAASQPAAGAPTSARGAATGTLNVTLSGGLNGTLTLRSVALCSDPARTGGGYTASFQTALAGVAYVFVVTVGIGYKGPGSYTTGTDDGTTVQMRGPTIRDVWEAVPGGKITVAADGSGTVDADLKNATGSPDTHVKGTFACKK